MEDNRYNALFTQIDEVYSELPRSYDSTRALLTLDELSAKIAPYIQYGQAYNEEYVTALEGFYRGYIAEICSDLAQGGLLQTTGEGTYYTESDEYSDVAEEFYSLSLNQTLVGTYSGVMVTQWVNFDDFPTMQSGDTEILQATPCLLLEDAIVVDGDTIVDDYTGATLVLPMNSRSLRYAKIAQFSDESSVT